MHVAPGNPGPQPSKASPPLFLQQSLQEGQPLASSLQAMGWGGCRQFHLCAVVVPLGWAALQPRRGRGLPTSFLGTCSPPPPGTETGVGEGHLSVRGQQGGLTPPIVSACRPSGTRSTWAAFCQRTCSWWLWRCGPIISLEAPKRICSTSSCVSALPAPAQGHLRSPSPLGSCPWGNPSPPASWLSPFQMLHSISQAYGPHPKRDPEPSGHVARKLGPRLPGGHLMIVPLERGGPKMGPGPRNGHPRPTSPRKSVCTVPFLLESHCIWLLTLALVGGGRGRGVG